MHCKDGWGEPNLQNNAKSGEKATPKARPLLCSAATAKSPARGTLSAHHTQVKPALGDLPESTDQLRPSD